jgi:hypothetical protein
MPSRITAAIAILIALGVLSSHASVAREPAQIAFADRAAELGEVRWRRDFDRVLAEAKTIGKPIMLLFQEVPGCQTCIDYGKIVMSHPLIVEAAEDLFIPVVVYNNKKGKDAETLKSYDEPAWNNPVLRFIDGSGKDLIDRKSRIYSLGPTAERMAKALTAADQPVPTYLTLVADEHAAKQYEEATFAMSCFWTGEAKLGSLEGVVLTRPAFREGHEVVELLFDPDRISYGDLVESARGMQVASRVFTHDEFQAAAAERIAPDIATKAEGRARKAPDSDHYHTLKRTPLAKLDLTEAQKTKINSALAVGGDPLEYLSPRQRAALPR